MPLTTQSFNPPPEGPMNRNYGWRLSPADPLDKIAVPPGLVLDEVDLRTGPMPLVFDQGQLGACTANAVAACLQYDMSLDRVLLGEGHAHRRSRLDIYYGERSLENNLQNGDTGAYGRDGFKFAQQTGVLLEQVWPYEVDTYAGPPPVGRRHKLEKRYAAVPQTVDHIKAVLSNKQPIAFGFTVYASFESGDVAHHGVVPMPVVDEEVLGGHEVVAVGYLADYPEFVLCRNSWGSGWGIAGYFLMPWKYITSPELAGDLRTIVRPT